MWDENHLEISASLELFWTFAISACLCELFVTKYIRLLDRTNDCFVSLIEIALKYRELVSLFSDISLSESTFNYKIGQLTEVVYFTTVYAHLAQAINRFAAIFNPVKYKIWFSKENSKFYIIVVVTLGLFHGIPYFFPTCNYYYEGVYVAWDYDYTPCYDILAFYIDFLVAFSIIGTVMALDTCTLFLIIRHKFLKKGNNKEAKFFFQTFFSSILYVLMIVSDQILSYLNINRWYVFVTSTMAWELYHVIDG